MHWNINEGPQFAKGAVRGDTLGVCSQVEEQMMVQSPGKPGQQEPLKQMARPLMQETPVDPTMLLSCVRAVGGGKETQGNPNSPQQRKGPFCKSSLGYFRHLSPSWEGLHHLTSGGWYQNWCP